MRNRVGDLVLTDNSMQLLNFQLGVNMQAGCRRAQKRKLSGKDMHYT